MRCAGEVIADANVDNDRASKRCLRLTSIANVKETEKEEEMIHVTVAEDKFCGIVTDIESIPMADESGEAVIERLVWKLELLGGEDFKKKQR